MSERLRSTRDGFGRGLTEIARENLAVVGLCADLTESTRMQEFATEFGERFIQTGVSEQNLVGVAAGLSMLGKIPFAASYAAFQPANSWGVIRASVAYSNANVKLIGGHAGLATGPDGATHQSLEDIALMRVLPNMLVLAPADFEEARLCVHAAVKHYGPVYIRTSKEPVPDCTNSSFCIGTAQTLVGGSDISLIAHGVLVSTALEVSKQMSERGISVRVINMATIKPLDTHSIDQAVRETSAVVTLEDHQRIGGLGSAVAEYVATTASATPVFRLGVDDFFGESGAAQELLDKHGLSVGKIQIELEKILDSVSKTA